MQQNNHASQELNNVNAEAFKEPASLSIIIGVDDTDDLSKETSTGAIAQHIADMIVKRGGVLHLGITRHQLLLSEEVPYTSHNSSMVFKASVSNVLLADIVHEAKSIIAKYRAQSSNPGFCIANLSSGENDPKFAQDSMNLMAFGDKAKVEFCHIKEAFELARSISWVELISCGGNESGVVGALAGVGLRLGGNDGRFRGKHSLSFLEDEKEVPTVNSAVRYLETRLAGPVYVLDVEEEPLCGSTPLCVISEAKPILRDSAFTIICSMKEGRAYPCTKDEIAQIANGDNALLSLCEAFEWDNDNEECAGKVKKCRNCLYRRWTAGGFSCIKAYQDNDHTLSMRG